LALIARGKAVELVKGNEEIEFRIHRVSMRVNYHAFKLVNSEPLSAEALELPASAVVDFRTRTAGSYDRAVNSNMNSWRKSTCLSAKATEVYYSRKPLHIKIYFSLLC
jgi:hypothetical protein